MFRTLPLMISRHAPRVLVIQPSRGTVRRVPWRESITPFPRGATAVDGWPVRRLTLVRFVGHRSGARWDDGRGFALDRYGHWRSLSTIALSLTKTGDRLGVSSGS